MIEAGRMSLNRDGYYTNPSGRNRRTVWHIATAPYSGAHFATYPPALVEPCIKAGTSERGVCPECGAPWERVVEKSPMINPDGSCKCGTTHGTNKSGNDAYIQGAQKMAREGRSYCSESNTIGWQPTCDCIERGLFGKRPAYDAYPTVPATVFDPFAGSGTTLQVARALGRHGVGLDLSAEYLQLARTRLELDRLDAWAEGAKKDGKPIDDLPMFGGLK